MYSDDIPTFLAAAPPFHLLTDPISRQNLASQLSEQFYPKDTVILQQNVQVCDALAIIKKGKVRLSLKSANEPDRIIDYRKEYDTFGFLSVISGERQKATVVAIEDTVCYLLDRGKFLQLLGANPEFTAHFLKLYIARRLNQAKSRKQGKSAFYGSGEHLLFTTQVGEVTSKNVLTVPTTCSVLEASAIMTNNQIGSLIVTDEKGRPLGIVTNKDLGTKFIAAGYDLKASVDSIMSQPLIWVDDRASCFDVMLEMVKHNLHHIPVLKGGNLEEGNLQGMITNHDLLLFQGASPLSFAKDIEGQKTIEDLAAVAEKISKVVILLVKQGSKASNISKLITELNDRISRKILTIAEQKFGPAPVSYCWIDYGSKGRKEQSLKTDQDNAIIYADPLSPEDDEQIKKYFSEFATFVCDSLAKCGFSECPANLMASNPKWCQPLSIWKSYFSEWINASSTEAILNSLIFFDFRWSFGDLGLADELKKHLALSAKEQKGFFAMMSNIITQNRPPLSIFNKIMVIKNDENKSKLDLKLRAISPMVDIARLFAIEAGITETATLERVKSLKDEHHILTKHASDFEDAYEFITLLRIRHQAEQIARGESPDNYIDLDSISGLKKRKLTESFRVIWKIQNAISSHYEPLFMLAKD